MNGPVPMAAHTDNGAGGHSSADRHAARIELEATEERLALLGEVAGAIGWWDWYLPEDCFRADARWAEAFGIDAATARQGIPLAGYMAAVHPEDRERVEKRFCASARTGGAFAEEFRVPQPDGTVLWLHAHGRAESGSGGRPARHFGVAIDITARKATERRKSALLELGDRLREIGSVEDIARAAAEVMANTLHATRAGFGTVEQTRETVTMQPDWHTSGTRTLAGLYHFREYGSHIDDLKRGEIVAIGDVTADARTRAQAQAFGDLGIRAFVDVPIIEHGRFVLVVFVHHDEPHAWSDAELNFVRSVADRTQAALGRLRAEEQQELLHRELGHRLKNNLAMAQSIVSQTLLAAPDLATGRCVLTKRLAAFGRAHRLLTTVPETGADMLAVVESALEGIDGERGRIRVDGLAFGLNAKAALSLSLMLHELATNAVKYGALSVTHGHVYLRWTRGDAEGEPVLRVTWREEGGPP